MEGRDEGNRFLKKMNERGEGLKEEDRKMDVEEWARDLEGGDLEGGVCEENRRRHFLKGDF